DMGMPLFLNPVPTGWPESGGAWSDSSQLMQRQQFSSKVALQDISEIYTYMDLPDYFRTHGVATAEGVVGYLFQVALGNDYSDVEWDMAMGVLTMDGNIPFDLNAADAEERLQQLLALVMSYPGYQLQ
ncbi:MAG: DUF1800 domain-containing protein, partial [Gammaproteobacteria bacterium]|nr:DUF1800 domain-containing protein [Gammaproteobacteria bacterium]